MEKFTQSINPVDLGSILHRRGHRLVIAQGFVPGLLSSTCHCQGFNVSSKTCSQVPLPPRIYSWVRMCPMLDGAEEWNPQWVTIIKRHWHHEELGYLANSDFNPGSLGLTLGHGFH